MADDRGERTGKASNGREWASVTDDWPDPLRTEGDYQIARTALIDYFALTVGGLNEEQITDSITRFAAAWHAGTATRRHQREASSGPSPKELAAAVHNDMLDLLS